MYFLKEPKKQDARISKLSDKRTVIGQKSGNFYYLKTTEL